MSFNYTYGSGFVAGDGPQHLPSYQVADLALGKELGESLSVRASATNLANTRYMLDQSNTFGGTHFADPRMLSLEVRYRFHF
jgi:outer membrane receptor protein involved in Fe transport